MLKPFHKKPELLNLLMSEEEVGIDLEIGEIPLIGSNPNIYNCEEITRDSKLEERLDSRRMDQLRNLLNRYSGIFSNEPGLTDLVVRDMELIGDRPVHSKPYRLSPGRNDILKSEKNRILQMKIIEVGESDYASPMILVESPDKNPRLSVDYRQLNRVIRTEYFPLPNIEERVEMIASAKYVTLVDLAKGYWQIKLSEREKRLAAFVTFFWVFRPLRMPFGVKNGAYVFSRLMAQILQGCEGFAVLYLDDIAIFSNEWIDHLKHLNCVLGKIAGARLTIKPSN